MKRNELLHPEYNNDLLRIKSVLGMDKFVEFAGLLDKQIKQLHTFPVEHTAPLEKPTLCWFGYRKLKFHSKKKINKGEKADMRLIYRFVEETNTLQILAVGFRWEKPDNVYQIAENRDNKQFINL